jgi:hypothetical protein
MAPPLIVTQRTAALVTAILYQAGAAVSPGNYFLRIVATAS